MTIAAPSRVPPSIRTMYLPRASKLARRGLCLYHPWPRVLCRTDTNASVITSHVKRASGVDGSRLRRRGSVLPSHRARKPPLVTHKPRALRIATGETSRPDKARSSKEYEVHQVCQAIAITDKGAVVAQTSCRLPHLTVVLQMAMTILINDFVHTLAYDVA